MDSVSDNGFKHSFCIAQDTYRVNIRLVYEHFKPCVLIKNQRRYPDISRALKRQVLIFNKARNNYKKQ